MPKLLQGRVVRLKTPRPDPQGRNTKSDRQYVATNSPASIAAGDDLRLVAITSEIKGGGDEVELDWSANWRHPSMSRLWKKSVAVCSWQEFVPQSDVIIDEGFIRPKGLGLILLKLHDYEEDD